MSLFENYIVLFEGKPRIPNKTRVSCEYIIGKSAEHQTLLKTDVSAFEPLISV